MHFYQPEKSVEKEFWIFFAPATKTNLLSMGGPHLHAASLSFLDDNSMNRFCEHHSPLQPPGNNHMKEILH